MGGSSGFTLPLDPLNLGALIDLLFATFFTLFGWNFALV
jgi:hypothetical protein